jgi:UPF0176 protein
MHKFVNIAAYKFVQFECGTLQQRRDQYLTLCNQCDLKGTILLSVEGINLFLAGTRENIDFFWNELTAEPELAELTYKESLSEHQPFTRLLVKIKKEIIAFGVDEIQPQKYTSRHLDAATLKQWLDEGRQIELLDTRNAYEYELGTFENAIKLDIGHFRQFPEAAKSIDPEIKKKTVVTFCTGGIRCEKAAPYLERLGFEDVYQLEGGILKYFEECGGEHYRGECFVFDHRVGVDAKLDETPTQMCFVCQQPLTIQQQASPDYVEAVSCPYCIDLQKSETNVVAIEKRNQAIRVIVEPLPGSTPYDNFRPLRVAEKYNRCLLIDWVCDLFAHLSRASWEKLIAAGRIRFQGQPVPADTIVQTGQVFQHLFPDTIEPAVNAAIQILYEDEAIFVVNKPAPLPMHPCGRFNRNTLIWVLNQVYKDEKPRMAHRLDANTSGVVVFARKRKWASILQTQFEKRTVQKNYLAIVEGHPKYDRWRCEYPISITPGQGGLRDIDSRGAAAITDFTVLEYRDNDTSVIEAVPITGRTNQIRIHLWRDNLPIQGDPVYRHELKLGTKHTLSIDQPPMCLHAKSIEFLDPLSNQLVRHVAPNPRWLDLNTHAQKKTLA